MRRQWRALAALAGMALVVIPSTAPAHAADRVYWANLNGGVPQVSFANLDGSGAGGDLSTAGATQTGAVGVTLFPSGGKVFWGDTGFTIGFANLDGSGAGGDLNTGGQPVSSPQGPAADPTSGRIYWANSFSSQGIYFASLNNNGAGGQLNTTGATLSSPIGVAVDPAGGRIYWANANPTNKISFANLDGSGGGDINTTGATVNNPQGVALDPAAGRIYWANVYGQKISFANLDGSGGGDLNTTGATVDNPAGVSVDVAGGKIYWGNVLGDKISFARLDDSGGGDLDTSGATTSFPNFPVVLKAPSGVSPPQITASRRSLLCSEGDWAGDLTPSFVYRAPRGFTFQWTRDGAPVPGVTHRSIAPTAAGHYRCLVTASNPAGAATQTSEAFSFFRVGKVKRNKKRGTARLPVTVPDPGSLTITGRGARVSRTVSVSAGTVRLLVQAKGRKRRKLDRNGRTKIRLTIAYSPVGAAPSTQPAKVRLKKR